MPVLSTKQRCNNCGISIRDPIAVECPSCHANLAEFGVTSELMEWGETRKMGRRRFVWKRHVLFWGGGMLFLFSIMFFCRGDFHPLILLWLALTCPLAGYILGSYTWRSAEREYAEFIKRKHLLEPVSSEREAS